VDGNSLDLDDQGSGKTPNLPLSQDSVKERGEKYPPLANCKYLTPTLVNEEIWDLLTRKNSLMTEAL